jgi:hypothetical protein
MVAVVVPSLNRSCTFPDGTPSRWKAPDASTVVEIVVPTTVTVSVEGAVAAVGPADAVANDAATPPLMVPEIVAPDVDGAVGEPPHATDAASVAQPAANTVR